MKRSTLFFLVALTVVLGLISALPVGCSWTKTNTTTDATGAITENSSSSVLLDVTEADIATMSNIVTVASNVWDLVSTILSATKSTTSLTLVPNQITLPDGTIMTKENVLKKTNVILLMCYKEAQRLPTAPEVAVYIRTGSLPSEAALIRFAQTGLLSE
jgi:hypothetical protein